MKVAPDFEQLVDAHYAALYRFGLSLTRNESEASDLTQQTFYLWATKGHQLRDGAQAKSWLFTTLYREFLGSRKKQERFPHAELDDIAEEVCAETPPPPEDFDTTALMEAMARLSPVFRAPLTLFYLQDFSYRQIADVLEIPPGTVMSRLARGKAELRRLLLEQEKQNASRLVPLPSLAAAGKKHE